MVGPCEVKKTAPSDTEGVFSIGPSVAAFQTTLPLLASSAYMLPSNDPMYTMPPDTAGEDFITIVENVFGKLPLTGAVQIRLPV